jgi:hypothetical protein
MGERLVEDKKVQQLIAEFAGLDKNDKKAILDKQQEILYALIKQEYIYTLLDKGTTLEQFKNNTGNILISGNAMERPCFRIYSEKSLAEDCARRYELTIDTPEQKNVPLVFKVTTKGMIKTAYSAMFKGLSDIVIDDGANWINVNVRDFVNSLYSYIGEEEIVNSTDFTFINIVNMLKYTDNGIFSVVNRESEDKSKIVQFFLQKNDADKYANEVLKNATAVKKFDLNGFNDLIVDTLNEMPEAEISIVFGMIIRRMKVAKANFFLNKML